MSSCEGEQDYLCVVIIEQYDTLLAGIRWLDVIGQLADLVLGVSHGQHAFKQSFTNRRSLVILLRFRPDSGNAKLVLLYQA